MGRDLFRRHPGHSKKLDCWMRAGDLFRRTPVHPKKLDPWIRAPLRASVMRGAELCLVGIEQGRPHLSQKRGRGRWISIGEDDDGGPIVREAIASTFTPGVPRLWPSHRWPWNVPSPKPSPWLTGGAFPFAGTMTLRGEVSSPSIAGLVRRPGSRIDAQRRRRPGSSSI